MSTVDILCMNIGVHACWHGLFNECYRHVRNVVHVKFGTDYPWIYAYDNKFHPIAMEGLLL